MNRASDECKEPQLKCCRVLSRLAGWGYTVHKRMRLSAHGIINNGEIFEADLDSCLSQLEHAVRAFCSALATLFNSLWASMWVRIFHRNSNQWVLTFSLQLHGPLGDACWSDPCLHSWRAFQFNTAILFNQEQHMLHGVCGYTDIELLSFPSLFCRVLAVAWWWSLEKLCFGLVLLVNVRIQCTQSSEILTWAPWALHQISSERPHLVCSKCENF